MPTSGLQAGKSTGDGMFGPLLMFRTAPCLELRTCVNAVYRGDQVQHPALQGSAWSAGSSCGMCAGLQHQHPFGQGRRVDKFASLLRTCSPCVDGRPSGSVAVL